MLRKKISLLLLLVMVFTMVFTGCSTPVSEPAKEVAKTEEPKVEETKVEARILRLASVLPPEHPSMQALQYFADLVKEGTNGALEVKLFGNSALGGLNDCMQGCQMGTIDFSYTNSGPMAQFVPSLNVVSLPYVFTSKQHMYNALEGEAGQKLVNDINSNGFVFLSWFDSGSRNVITSKKGVTKPEDMKGLKIRVMNSEQMIKTLNSMGGIATPMEQGEVYNALQQGVLDGWENSPVTLLTLKLYEVSKQFSWTQHFIVPDLVIMSPKTFNSLTKEQQDVIIDAGKKTQVKQSELWDAYSEKVVNELKGLGVEFTDVDDLTPFVKAVAPVWEDYKVKYGDELLNMIVNAK